MALLSKTFAVSNQEITLKYVQHDIYGKREVLRSQIRDHPKRCKKKAKLAITIEITQKYCRWGKLNTT